MASLFSVGAGGNKPNLSALASTAAGLASAISPKNAGAIGTALTAAQTISSAYTAMKGLAGKGLGVADLAKSVFADGALAGVANSAFGDAASSLGITDGIIGDYFTDGQFGAGGDIPRDWVFITAPQNISWDKQGETSLVNTYGSNNPYVIYSTTGSRKLTLGDCLIEGFSAGKEVEDHITKLEKMMTMVMNTQKGYVSPYVWDLRANDKSYGQFIINSVNVTEQMRNQKGRADRAMASIELQQVPDFQVNTGRDLATKVDLASGKSIASEDEKKAKGDGVKGAAANDAREAGNKVKDPTPVSQGPKKIEAVDPVKDLPTRR